MRIVLRTASTIGPAMRQCVRPPHPDRRGRLTTGHRVTAARLSIRRPSPDGRRCARSADGFLGRVRSFRRPRRVVRRQRPGQHQPRAERGGQHPQRGRRVGQQPYQFLGNPHSAGDGLDGCDVVSREASPEPHPHAAVTQGRVDGRTGRTRSGTRRNATDRIHFHSRGASFAA